MHTVRYYWHAIGRGTSDGRAVLREHLLWEIAVTLAVGILAALLGANATQAVLIPLAAIGALCVIVIASNIVLTPVRMWEESRTREAALVARLRGEQNDAAIQAELTTLYDCGKRILTLMESGNFATYTSDVAMQAWRSAITAFYNRIGKPGRAATWDSEFELDAADGYSTGTKVITGDLARICHIVRFGLREIGHDVEHGSVL